MVSMECWLLPAREDVGWKDVQGAEESSRHPGATGRRAGCLSDTCHSLQKRASVGKEDGGVRHCAVGLRGKESRVFLRTACLEGL